MSLSLAPSEEQRRILALIGEGRNVLGDCVAGSGKTTSVLLLAQMYPGKRILQVTYNSQLKTEVRQKGTALGLTNLEVHTYNSLCVKYYHREGYKNDKLRDVTERNTPPISPLPRKDVVVLDETQDMTMIFYRLVKKFLSESPNKHPTLLCLGDKYQGLYKFMGADARYLTLSPSIWERPFVPCTLTTSYRLTNQMASFVNNVMLGYSRIKAVRAGPKVTYKVCDPWQVHTSICDTLLPHLLDGSVKPDDIFVLAGSIKSSKTPVRLLENAFAAHGIPCYFPVSDDKAIDEEVIGGKVVFSTFHQAKGRERKIVILYGFDDTYFQYYGKEYDPTVCPETLYVAATRAKERLFLLQSNRATPLPFLKQTVAEMAWLPYMEVQGVPRVIAAAAATKDDRHRTTPTELVRYLSEPTLQLLDAVASELFEVEEVASYSVAIPSKVGFDGTVEDVSDINGIAIPAMYEALTRKDESTIETYTREAYDSLCRDDEHPFLRAAYARLGKTIKSATGFVRLTVMYVSLVEKLYHKMNQITHHNWITKAMMDACFVALDKHVPPDAKYELAMEHTSNAFPEYGAITVCGRMDVVSKDHVLEIKCVDALTLEHKMQLVVYAWIWREESAATEGSRVFKLVNIRTGDVLRLRSNSHLIDEAVRILMDNKYTKLPEVSDAVFVERCLRGVDVPRSCVADSGSGFLLVDDAGINLVSYV